MAAITNWVRGRRLDDDEEDGPYDPNYGSHGRYRRWSRQGPDSHDRRDARVASAPHAVFDASLHRPHQAVLDEQMLKDRGRAEDARHAYIARICDGWRGPGSERRPAPSTGESARDATSDGSTTHGSRCRTCPRAMRTRTTTMTRGRRPTPSKRSGAAGRPRARGEDSGVRCRSRGKRGRQRALDPQLSGDDVKLARREMDDAMFHRVRLCEAATILFSEPLTSSTA